MGNFNFICAKWINWTEFNVRLLNRITKQMWTCVLFKWWLRSQITILKPNFMTDVIYLACDSTECLPVFNYILHCHQTITSNKCMKSTVTATSVRYKMIQKRWDIFNAHCLFIHRTHRITYRMAICVPAFFTNMQKNSKCSTLKITILY